MHLYTARIMEITTSASEWLVVLEITQVFTWPVATPVNSKKMAMLAHPCRDMKELNCKKMVMILTNHCREIVALTEPE